MPRTNLCKREVPHAQLGRLIAGAAAVNGTPVGEVAAILGCSDNTARARLRHPGDLTIEEATLLARGLHIPIEELRAAIRY